MVAVGFEDGVEIDAGDPQLLQIGELLPDAVEIAAEIVVRSVGPAAAVRPVDGLLRPVPMEIHLPPHALMVGGAGGHGRMLAATEAVREYLVGHGLAEPGGGLIVRGVDGELPELAPVLPKLAPPGAAAVVQVPAILADEEPIEHEARLVHGPDAQNDLLPYRPHGQHPLPRPVPQQQEHLAADVRGLGGDLHLLVHRHGTLGTAIGYVQRIMLKIHDFIILIQSFYASLALPNVSPFSQVSAHRLFSIKTSKKRG